MRNRYSHNVTIEVNGKIEQTCSFSNHINAIDGMLSYVENRPVVMKSRRMFNTNHQEYVWENAPLDLTIKFYITASRINSYYGGRCLMDSIFTAKPDAFPISTDGKVIPFQPANAGSFFGGAFASQTRRFHTIDGSHKKLIKNLCNLPSCNFSCYVVL